MKFTVDAGALVKALEPAARAASVRGSVAILGFLRFEAREKQGDVRVSGTDMDVFITGTARANVERSGVVIAGPSKRLLAALKTLDGDVTVTVRDGKLYLTRGSTTVGFVTLPVDDFPRLPPVEERTLSVGAKSFAQLFEGVRRIYSRDESRPVLTGIKIESAKGFLRMVATDSYRLAVQSIPQSQDVPALDAVVRGDALELVKRHLAGQVEVGIIAHTDTPHVSFVCGPVTVTARRIDGQFPDYWQLRPDKFEGTVVFDRARTLSAAQRIVKLGSSRAPLRLTVASGVAAAQLEFHEQDGLDIVETLDVEVAMQHEGEGLSIGANPAMFAEALECFGSDRVTLHVINPLRPMLFQNGDAESWHLLMPIRLAG